MSRSTGKRGKESDLILPKAKEVRVEQSDKLHNDDLEDVSSEEESSSSIKFAVKESSLNVSATSSSSSSAAAVKDNETTLSSSSSAAALAVKDHNDDLLNEAIQEQHFTAASTKKKSTCHEINYGFLKYKESSEPFGFYFTGIYDAMQAWKLFVNNHIDRKFLFDNVQCTALGNGCIIKYVKDPNKVIDEDEKFHDFFTKGYDAWFLLSRDLQDWKNGSVVSKVLLQFYGFIEY